MRDLEYLRKYYKGNIEDALKRLKNGEPVQYIVGEVDFCGNILMPLVALLTCIFTGWVIKPSFIIEEVDTYNHKFKTKKIYMLMIKYIAPIVIFILFLESTGLLNIFLCILLQDSYSSYHILLICLRQVCSDRIRFIQLILMNRDL